ncbi:hypothetical protein LTR10_012284 [Elasticomyces elasticus]|nr:hypothetical protein LTR10_012284 [Elasticomyces elasticus]
MILLNGAQQVTALPKVAKHTGHLVNSFARFDRFDCHDDRDRIYALLSVHGPPGLRPDYSLSVEDAYYRVAEAFVRHEGLGAILWQAAGRVCRGHPRSDDGHPGFLPAWVPDWRLPAMLPGQRKLVFSEEYCINADRTLSIHACMSLPLVPAYYAKAELRIAVHFLPIRRPTVSEIENAIFKRADLQVLHVLRTQGDVRAGDRLLWLDDDCRLPIGQPRHHGHHSGQSRQDQNLMDDRHDPMETAARIVVREVSGPPARYQIVGWCLITAEEEPRDEHVERYWPTNWYIDHYRAEITLV